jgi:TetR/AcrR family transcriptional repressor of nem operon
MMPKSSKKNDESSLLGSTKDLATETRQPSEPAAKTTRQDCPMTSRDTREALLLAGLELFLEGGYDFVGTNAILARAKAPRGSFYHHFADKEAFALAVAEYYYEKHLPTLDRALSEEGIPPLKRLARYFETLARDFARAGYTGGCLLGILSQELAERSPAARHALSLLFGRWRHRITDCLREARERRELRDTLDCGETAAFILDAWEGALLQMKLKKSGAPLDGFLRIVFVHLLRAE